MTKQRLLADIEAFLEETGMGPSYFGKLSVGISDMVDRLRAGRDVTTNTAEKVRAFMRHYRRHGEAPEDARNRMRERYRRHARRSQAQDAGGETSNREAAPRAP